jgi:hypothetical protein
LRWVDGCGAPGEVAVLCDDGEPCTADACDDAAKACVHTPDDTPACQALCSMEEEVRCEGGHVVAFDPCGAPSSIVQSCDDGDPCTLDVCDAEGAICIPLDGPAASDPATGEPCLASCAGAPAVVCSGGSLVWLDSCGEQAALVEGCVHGCADGDAACAGPPDPDDVHHGEDASGAPDTTAPDGGTPDATPVTLATRTPQATQQRAARTTR